MKRFSFLLPVLLSLGSCSSKNEMKTTTTSTPTADVKDTSVVTDTLPEKLCFRQVQGRDTSIIELTISENQVQGRYDWKPFEKDARKGTLDGMLQAAGAEKLLQATWTYQQEGMNQSLPFEALLTADILRQKAYRVDMRTGEEVLETGNSYSVFYQRIDCKQ